MNSTQVTQYVVQCHHNYYYCIGFDGIQDLDLMSYNNKQNTENKIKSGWNARSIY